ncbi:MAG: phospholipase D-like domain-containing protein, partial [Oscillospiraceae bacterium]|nr:phospholipase D-like domain-containing protein [Oscillospiraceae bacterium]
MKYIFRLVNLIVLCIILQGLYFLALVYTLANLSPQVHFAMTALGIICVLFIISGRDAAVYKLLWSVIILLFPAVMGVAYLFYNRRKTGRKVESAFLEARKNSLGFTDKSTRLTPDSTNNERLARYIEKTTGASCASYSDAVYFPQGEDFHKRFLEELKAAKKYIFIEFFIIEQGKMWSEIFEVLKRKQSEGVEIRIVYDGLATLYTLPRRYYKTLRSEGFKCIVYNPLRRFISFRLNTRNHRKIAVIDGTAAFCGGLNLADAYINEKQSKSGKRPKTGHWKDSAVMVKGG